MCLSQLWFLSTSWSYWGILLKVRHCNLDLCITVFCLVHTPFFLLFCSNSYNHNCWSLGLGGRLSVNIRKILIKPGDTLTSFRSTTLNLRNIVNHFFLWDCNDFSLAKDFCTCTKSYTLGQSCKATLTIIPRSPSSLYISASEMHKMIPMKCVRSYLRSTELPPAAWTLSP